MLSARWRFQPQYPALVDWSNPLNRNLVFLFNAAGPTGAAVNLADGGLATIGAAGQPGFANVAGYQCRDYGAASSAGESWSKTYGTTGAMSVAVLAYDTNNATKQPGAGPIHPVTFSAGDFGICFTTSAWRTVYTTGSTISAIGTARSTLANQMVFAVGTVDGTNVNHYENGKLIKSSATGFAASASTVGMAIGASTSGGGAQTLKIPFVALWQRALSLAEIDMLYRETVWQLFTPAPPKRFYSVAAASFPAGQILT